MTKYIVLFCIAAFFLKKLKYLKYNLIIAAIYLASLIEFQELDNTLSLYFFFAVFPLLKYTKFAFKRVQLFFLIYFVALMVLSVFSNGLFSAASQLIIRLGGFVYFVLFFNIRDGIFEKWDKIKLQMPKIIFFCALIELFYGMYVMLGADTQEGRLMLNYQCVNGCMATSVILLFFLLPPYNHILRLSKNSILVYASILIMSFFVLQSATRGYILMVFPMFALLLFCWYRKRVILLIILFILLFTLYVLSFPESFSAIIEMSRFGESTGYRDLENIFAIKFLSKGSFSRLLFGYGLGTNFGEYTQTYSILNQLNYKSWLNDVIKNKSGLHCFWITIIYSSGFVGLLSLIFVFIDFIKSTVKMLKPEGFYKFIPIIYLGIYCVVLWFRWTATSGILEFSILIAYLRYKREMLKSKKEQVAN